MPVSSSTAHLLQASAALAAKTAEKTRVETVQREYIRLKPAFISPIATLPFPASLPQSDAYLQFSRTVKTALNDILVFCDASGTNIKSLDYVRGWDRPLEKALVSAIAPGKPSTIDFTVSINEYFEQVRRELDQGSSGPSAFRLLLRLLADQFDSGDNQESFLRLQSFGVSDGTPFSTYLRAFR